MEPGSKKIDLKHSARSKPVHAMVTVDQVPPHSIEAEQGVLGCILLSPSESLEACLLKFGNDHEHVFYDLRHQAIFDLMVGLYKKGEAVDLITMHQRLKDTVQLEAIGGFHYLASLPDAVPSAANLEYYLSIVWEKFLLRQTIENCSNTISYIYETDEETQTVLNKNAAESNKIAEKLAMYTGDASSAKDCIIRLSEQLDERMKLHGQLPGISTGFSDLDRRILGLEKKKLYVIGARPQQGKTAMMGNMIEHISIKHSIPTLCFSLEMPSEALALRICCSMSSMDSRLVRMGRLTSQEHREYSSAMARFSAAPVHIIDKSDITPSQMLAVARSYIRKFGIQVAFIDYAQRIKPDRKMDIKTYEVGEISSSIQDMAKILEIPIVLLAQIKREYQVQTQSAESESRRNRLPTMADLGDSGMLERDPDAIMLLCRSPDQDLSAERWTYKLNVDKSRDGEPGVVDLGFFKRYTRFFQMVHQNVDSVDEEWHP